MTDAATTPTEAANSAYLTIGTGVVPDHLDR
jgi:hypothetical protein